MWISSNLNFSSIFYYYYGFSFKINILDYLFCLFLFVLDYITIDYRKLIDYLTLIDDLTCTEDYDDLLLTVNWLVYWDYEVLIESLAECKDNGLFFMNNTLYNKFY